MLHDLHAGLPGGVTLVPGSKGFFEVSFGDRVVFSKKEQGRFPDDGEVLGRLGKMLELAQVLTR